jgi:hypothetical protein
MMPTAWEETDGAGLPVGLRTVGGAGVSSDIEWNVGLGLPDGMNVYASFAPEPDGSKNANKGVGGASATVDGNGWDIVLTHSGLYDGLNVFAGYSEIEQNAGIGDRTQHAYGATYAIGGATLGYQYSKDDTPGATSEYYENNAYGVSFSVNDNLAISYGVHESKRNTTAVEIQAESIQVSYTVGGASVKIAENSADNVNYVSAANKDGRTIALTLAF